MEEKRYINKWKDYHNSLADGVAKKCKEEIERVLNISQSAFYRKIKHPDRFLSIAEKQAIEKVYHFREGSLFPELVQ